MRRGGLPGPLIDRDGSHVFLHGWRCADQGPPGATLCRRRDYDGCAWFAASQLAGSAALPGADFWPCGFVGGRGGLQARIAARRRRIVGYSLAMRPRSNVIDAIETRFSEFLQHTWPGIRRAKRACTLVCIHPMERLGRIFELTDDEILVGHARDHTF